MINTNSNLFKLAMSKFATGVTVISMNKRNEYLGKTVNSFASLSLNPPLILFSLDKNSSSIKEYTLDTNEKIYITDVVAKFIVFGVVHGFPMKNLRAYSSYGSYA